MSKLEIIYLPSLEGLYFPLYSPPLEGISPKKREILSQNYSRLKSRIDLPDEIGVISLNPFSRQSLENQLSDFKEFGINSEGYSPLTICEKMLHDVSREDLADFSTAQMLYREFGVYIMHPSLGFRDDPSFNHLLALVSTVPIVEGTSIEMSDFFDRIGDITELQDFFGTNSMKMGEELVNSLKGRLGFSLIEVLMRKFRNEFDKNKISREFPLTYSPSKEYFPLEVAQVSLKDSLCLSSHLESIQRMNPELDLTQFQISNLGRTTHRNNTSLEELLGKLPPRKVILTDLYLAHLFPEFEDIDIETREIDIKCDRFDLVE